jgi:RNA polymerase sigma factor (TIGR02999 family)
MMRPDHDVTRLLLDLSGGDEQALDRLLPLVYEELRRLARRHLGREREMHTLSTAELVHEAYCRLVDLTRMTWRDRAHFFAVAAGVMRRILVDWARARKAQKRGGDLVPLSLDALSPDAAGGRAALDLPADQRAEELLALDELLDRLALLNARQARVVEYRYFAGLSVEETAEALGISATTVKQDWMLARTWLYRELQRALA